MKKILFLLTLLIATTANAQQKEWERVAGGDTTDYYFKVGGYYIGEFRGKKTISATYKQYDAKTKSTDVGRIFLQVKDCERQEGRLYWSDFDGNVSATANFILGVNTVGAKLAESLCKIWSMEPKQ